MDNNTLKQSRRDYKNEPLLEADVAHDPFVQFDTWLQEVLRCTDEDPTAMVLSTVDAHSRPDSRVVLLKGIKEKQFIFYTNYSSHKAEQLDGNTYAALNFFWPCMCRQIRIRGVVSRLNREESASYFSSRPRESQLGALASKQSSAVARSELDERYDVLSKRFEGEELICPDYWGGYALSPFEFEFWHGRKNRLHDRLFYELDSEDAWQLQRLAS
jgi:pyridoxamine 5'-phosphate oxidase